MATLPRGPPETRTGPARFGIVLMTRLYSGLTRASAPAAPSATQTAFLQTATPVGVEPDSVIVCESVRERESIRESVLSSWFAAHTEPAPTSIAPGRTPTAICPTTLFVFGLITPIEFGGTTSPALGRVARTKPAAMPASTTAPPAIGTRLRHSRARRAESSVRSRGNL